MGVRDAERRVPIEVACVAVSTGPYAQFTSRFLEYADRMLIPDGRVTFVLLADHSVPRPSRGGLRVFRIPHLPWPFNALFRYAYMSRIGEELRDYDLIVYLDIDMLVHTPVTLADLPLGDKPFFGVQHPHFAPHGGTFETNPRSRAFLDRSRYDTTYYHQACFWGGRTVDVLDMVELLAGRVEADWSEGIIAIWHDQSYLNRYFSEHALDVLTLDPAFAFPQSHHSKRGLEAAMTEEDALSAGSRILHLWKDPDDYPLEPGGRVSDHVTVPLPTRL